MGRCKDIAKGYNIEKSIEVRGEDIPLIVSRFVREGKKTIGITGEDLFKEFLIENRDPKIKALKTIAWEDEKCIFGKPTLCLLGPKGKTLNELPKILRVGINEKYKELAKRDCLNNLENKGYKLDKIYASGSTEELFVNGIVDLVIEIVYSGKSAEEANLSIYEKLFESDIVIIGAKDQEYMDFKKMNGLIPTIIQDNNGKILSLVYSNEESLRKTRETNRVWRYSRAMQQVVMKGQSSGNTQEVISINRDCDSDALLFKVRQKGNACHTGKYSCFGGVSENFSIQDLYDKIKSRIDENNPESYTKKLMDDPLLLKRKLVEEAAEVITAKDRENLVWECADLLYFLFVTMAKEGITIQELEKENQRRNGKSQNKEVSSYQLKGGNET